MEQKGKLFQIERKRNVMNMLNKQPSVTVSELAKVFQVSEVTIRKDLRELGQAGYLTRIHGGAAVSAKMTFEPVQSDKEKQNIEAKSAIARQAYELIQPGDSILIDAGSTTLLLARLICESAVKNVTVITHSLTIANELVNLHHVELIMLGGLFRTGIYSCVGPITESVLKTLHVDKAFLGCNSIHLDYGLSTANIFEAEVKRQMMASSEESVLLADHTKFGKISLSFIAPIGDLSYLITDANTPVEIAQNIEAMGPIVISA